MATYNNNNNNKNNNNDNNKSNNNDNNIFKDPIEINGICYKYIKLLHNPVNVSKIFIVENNNTKEIEILKHSIRNSGVEYKTLNKLQDHPNVVTLLNYKILENNTHYLLMEYGEIFGNKSFKHFELRGHKFKEILIQSIFCQMVVFLGFGHIKETFQRDIKFDNTILFYSIYKDQIPCIKHIDFELSAETIVSDIIIPAKDDKVKEEAFIKNNGNIHSHLTDIFNLLQTPFKNRSKSIYESMGYNIDKDHGLNKIKILSSRALQDNYITLSDILNSEYIKHREISIYNFKDNTISKIKVENIIETLNSLDEQQQQQQNQYQYQYQFQQQKPYKIYIRYLSTPHIFPKSWISFSNPLFPYYSIHSIYIIPIKVVIYSRNELSDILTELIDNLKLLNNHVFDINKNNKFKRFYVNEIKSKARNIKSSDYDNNDKVCMSGDYGLIESHLVSNNNNNIEIIDFDKIMETYLENLANTYKGDIDFYNEKDNIDFKYLDCISNQIKETNILNKDYNLNININESYNYYLDTLKWIKLDQNLNSINQTATTATATTTTTTTTLSLELQNEIIFKKEKKEKIKKRKIQIKDELEKIEKLIENEKIINGLLTSTSKDISKRKGVYTEKELELLNQKYNYDSTGVHQPLQIGRLLKSINDITLITNQSLIIIENLKKIQLELENNPSQILANLIIGNQ